MQFRLLTDMTLEKYVQSRAWRRASLETCPVHGTGRCTFARHGTYIRKTACGEAHVARWYCPDSQITFSLLPDCLASGLPGSMAELEAAVALSETRPVLTEAARQAHPNPDVGAKAARRWLTRRRDAVHTCLWVLITLMPELFRLCQPTVLGLRDRLGHADVLPTLCALLALRRMLVPGTIGVSMLENAMFGEREISQFRCQQSMSPDPPAISGQLVARLRDRCLAATCDSPET